MKPILLDQPIGVIAEYAGYLSKQADINNALAGTPTIPLNLTADAIPVDHMQELLLKDPYMTTDQKGQALAIVHNTGYDTKSGKTSVADLAKGAIHAGFGLAGGLVAGHVMGKLFSLPMPVTRALSATGGIAGALLNTGIVT